MRAAMARAVVGDDVLDDDPTIHELQDKAAALLGMEAALFMPSGTMSNLVAMKVHTSPGDEILLDCNSHTMLYEVGGAAAIAQVLTRQFCTGDGVPDLDQLTNLVSEQTLHSPRTALLMLENSHNRAGGIVIPLEVHTAIHDEFSERGVPIHLDGARLFNAATALGVPASVICKSVDSVTFCLSKGLGCPVGSVLCGRRGFISQARRVRKMLGGGMRQAGILAAAGIYALDHNIDRLHIDHSNARRMASALAGCPGINGSSETPHTNMVYLNTVAAADAIVERARSRFGVLVSQMGAHVLRAVTHMDVDSGQIDHAANVIRTVCAELNA